MSEPGLIVYYVLVVLVLVGAMVALSPGEW